MRSKQYKAEGKPISLTLERRSIYVRPGLPIHAKIGREWGPVAFPALHPAS